MIAVLDTSAAVEVVLKRESSALFTDFLAEAQMKYQKLSVLGLIYIYFELRQMFRLKFVATLLFPLQGIVHLLRFWQTML